MADTHTAFLRLCTALREELNRPLPGGRGFQEAHHKRIKALAERLASCPLPYLR